MNITEWLDRVKAFVNRDYEGDTSSLMTIHKTWLHLLYHSKEHPRDAAKRIIDET